MEKVEVHGEEIEGVSFNWQRNSSTALKCQWSFLFFLKEMEVFFSSCIY